MVNSESRSTRRRCPTATRLRRLRADPSRVEVGSVQCFRMKGMGDTRPIAPMPDARRAARGFLENWTCPTLASAIVAESLRAGHLFRAAARPEIAASPSRGRVNWGHQIRRGDTRELAAPSLNRTGRWQALIVGVSEAVLAG